MKTILYTISMANYPKQGGKIMYTMTLGYKKNQVVAGY